MKVIICINQNTRHKMKVKASHSALPLSRIPLTFLSFSDSLPYRTDLIITLWRRRSQLTLGGLAGAICPQAQHFHPSALAKVKVWEMEVKKARDKKKGHVRVNITPSFSSSLPAPSRHLLTPTVFQETKPWVSQCRYPAAHLWQQLGPQLSSDPGHLSTAPKVLPCPVLAPRLEQMSWAWDFAACLWRVALRLKWEAGKTL